MAARMILWRLRGVIESIAEGLSDGRPRFHFHKYPGRAIAADEIDFSPLPAILTVHHPKPPLLKIIATPDLRPNSQELMLSDPYLLEAMRTFLFAGIPR